MDTAELERLVGENEGIRVEFKAELPRNMGDVAKTLSAFANTYGGTFIVGIRDDKELAQNPRLDRIVGVDDPDEVIQRIAGQTRVLRPALNTEIARMLVDGKCVVYARVNREPDTAYAYEGRFYQRVGSTSQAISEAVDVARLVQGVDPVAAEEPLVMDRAVLNEFELGQRRLLGREVPLGRLQDFWTDRFDSVAVITGSGGVGKTALLDSFMDWLLRQPSPMTSKQRPEAVVYVTAKEKYLDYMTAPPQEQQFRSLRHVLEVMLKTLWQEDCSAWTTEALERFVLESAAERPVLLALDNLETLELDELQQLERFLSRLRWPSKAIVTTRERRMTVNCHIHLHRLEEPDAVALLQREMTRRGTDLRDANRSSLAEIADLVGGVPAFLIHCAHVMDKRHFSLAEMIDIFKGSEAFDIQEYSYESSLAVLDQDSLRVLLFLAHSRTPRSRKALMQVVGNGDALDLALGSLVSDHFLVRRDQEQSALRFVIGNRQIRDYVRRQVPTMLTPEASASVLQLAGVTATEAVAPQIVFEVTRVVNSVRALISGGPGEWHDGVGQLEAARARFGDQPVLLYWLGRFHWRLENRPAAIDFFERAIDAGSVQADTYAYLALVLMWEKRFEEGLRRATQALALQLEHPLAGQVAGQCLLGAARNAEAIIGRAETLKMLEQAQQHLQASLIEPPRSAGEYGHNVRTRKYLAEVAELVEWLTLPEERRRS